MAQMQVRCLELNGTYYEIGQRLGSLAASIPPLKAYHSSGEYALSRDDAEPAMAMLRAWCPGIDEEIQGFADALGIDPARAVFYTMTCLKPRCSHMVALPPLTRNGHVLVARSYEFSEKLEDFALMRTSPAGKYAHLGSSVLFSGRDEGLNERGLAVTMSSCGFPVGAPEGMRAPKLHGLQFWVVIRTLLENCADVDNALRLLAEMPIAYNLNLLLADRTGKAALFETMDGHKAVRHADDANYLCATNHVLLPELKPYEPMAMRNSVERCTRISAFMDNAQSVASDDLKRLLLKPYPAGLCCHDYENFFGTTKSIVMDVTTGMLEVCWGGLEKNGWIRTAVNEPLAERIQPVEIVQESLKPEFFDMVEI